MSILDKLTMYCQEKLMNLPTYSRLEMNDLRFFSTKLTPIIVDFLTMDNSVDLSFTLLLPLLKMKFLSFSPFLMLTKMD